MIKFDLKQILKDTDQQHAFIYLILNNQNTIDIILQYFVFHDLISLLLFSKNSVDLYKLSSFVEQKWFHLFYSAE